MLRPRRGTVRFRVRRYPLHPSTRPPRENHGVVHAVATANAWKRLLTKQMGKREFVGSRAKRIAMKVNPLTQCVTDEECLLEIEESGEFFEEPPLDRAETLS